MKHVIEVSFKPTPNVGEKLVHVEPNSLPAINSQNLPPGPGDTVTWRFNETTVEKGDLQVLFQQYADFPDLTPLKPCSPLGPFSSLTLGIGVIVGTVQAVDDTNPSRRFFYKLIENGKELTWDNPVEGAPDKVLGGVIDHPPTPP